MLKASLGEGGLTLTETPTFVDSFVCFLECSEDMCLLSSSISALYGEISFLLLSFVDGVEF
jgi:hypothetical protein